MSQLLVFPFLITTSVPSLSVADIDPEMGSLHVVPGSHLDFKEGLGHGDVSQLHLSFPFWMLSYNANEGIAEQSRVE